MPRLIVALIALIAHPHPPRRRPTPAEEATDLAHRLGLPDIPPR